MSSAQASASARSVGGPSSGTDPPKPGRSAATTAKSAPSGSTTEANARRDIPMPWTSSNGGPLPPRMWSSTRGSVDGATDRAPVRLAALAHGPRRNVQNMLTVRDMVEVTGVRVVAGAAGLDRPVRWVHISELSDPTPWLNGGELLLTTGMTVNGDGDEYVERIAAHGLAGLGVGTGVGGLDTVTPEMVAAAERLDFPVLEVPYETPFIALTEKAFTRLAAEQARLLQRATTAHDRLERVALSEAGLEGLVAALGEQIAGRAAVLDARGAILAGEPIDGGLELAVPGDSGARLMAEGAATELNRLIVHQAVTIVALELLRRRVAEDTERRLAGDILASVLSGELAGEALARRLEPFGIVGEVAAVVADGAAQPQLEEAVRAEAGAGLTAWADGLACALIPARDDVFELAERIRARAGIAAAGAGRPVAVADTRRGFHEARWALEAATLDGERPAAVHLPRPRLLPAAARDAGRRRAAHLLRLDPEPARGVGHRATRRSCCARWRSSSSATASGSGQPASCTATVTPSATGSSASSSSPGRSLACARDRIDFWLALRGRELTSPRGTSLRSSVRAKPD